jgi:hypothetical protein
MKKSIPVILLGTERSGTNLLRAIVGSHSAVASPPPSGMAMVLNHRAFRYVSPLKRMAPEDMASAMIAVTKTHLTPWEETLDTGDVMEHSDPCSFWSVFRAMHDIYAAKKGCRYWLSKEPGLFNHIYEIAFHMPDSKFIYLARDGRDVAVSMLNTGLHAFHVYDAARSWAGQQRKCLNAMSDPLLRDRIFFLRYEDLIQKTETQCRLLMDFIGLEFEKCQLEYYRKKDIVEHSQNSECWKRLSEPVDSLNSGTYKSSLTAREIRIVERTAWIELDALGYKLEGRNRKALSSFEASLCKISSKLKRWRAGYMPNEEMKKHQARQGANRNIIDRSLSR